MRIPCITHDTQHIYFLTLALSDLYKTAVYFSLCFYRRFSPQSLHSLLFRLRLPQSVQDRQFVSPPFVKFWFPITNTYCSRFSFHHGTCNCIRLCVHFLFPKICPRWYFRNDMAFVIGNLVLVVSSLTIICLDWIEDISFVILHSPIF